MLVVDHILKCCRLSIPIEVKRETVDSGLLFGYQDAKELEMRINRGSIAVLDSESRDIELEPVLTSIGLENVDRTVIHACIRMPKQTKLVTDDHRLFVCAIRLGSSPIFLVDLVVLLAAKRLIKAALAAEILHTIQPRYTRGFVELSVKRLEGVI